MGKIERVIHITHKAVVVIRHTDVEDAEELIRHIKKVESETMFLLREADEFILTVEQERQLIQSKLDSDVDLQIIAEIDGKIVGSCGLNGDIRKRIRHCAKLGIAVEKEYYGMGIGKKMLAECIEWARKNGISRITLEVDTNNFRAISLYLKFGFEIEGTLRKDKRLADGTYVSGYTMALLL